MSIVEYRPKSIIEVDSTDKVYRSRVAIFAQWMSEQKREWYQIDLAEYRDYLLQDRSENSVKSYLGAVRKRYKEILRDSNLWNNYYADMFSRGMTKADANADIERLQATIRNQIDPESAPVKVLKKRDVADEEKGLWLTNSQAKQLLEQPGLTTLRGLRDTSVIAIMLCAGLREFEVAALKVEDLRQHLNGALALRVNRGKGAVQRLVPYGDMDWVLVIVDAWMSAAGITDGYVFRGFWKGSKRVRETGLSANAGSIDDILARYPIVIDGVLTTVKPHDGRRTYATALYNSGMGEQEIADNMGHSDTKTTRIYIKVNSDKRQPGNVYKFDLKKLQNL